jgi:hypothetical protein
MAADKDRRPDRDADAEDATEIVTTGGDNSEAAGRSWGTTEPGHGAATAYPFDDSGEVTQVTEPDAATEVQPPIGVQPSQVIPPAAAGRSRSPLVRWLSVAAIVIAVVLAALLLVDRLDPSRDGAGPRSDAEAPAVAVVESALAAGDVDDLPARLLKAVRSHPDNSTLAALLADANHYLDLLHFRDTGQVLVLAQQRSEAPFESPLFEAAAAREIDPAIPAADVVERMAEAEADWERGELVEAIESARQLSKAPGSEWAAERLQHYTRVVEAYDRLSPAAGTGAYPRRLLDFYLGLDSLHDRFFWGRLARDFEPVGDELAVVEGQLRLAARAWNNYWSRGAVPARIRQQARPEDALGRQEAEFFRQQAMELSEAHRLLAAVVSRATQLAGNPSTAYLFPSQVAAEIARQRDLLETLLVINDDPVFRDKLALLPESAPRDPAAMEDTLTEPR